MALRRASHQAGRTLREHYTMLVDLPADNPLSSVGAAMLELLSRLDAVCAERDVFGVTVEDVLHLQASDDAGTAPAVIVRATADGEIRVSYRMPPREAPWQGATVQGIASSPDAAARMVALAMQRSGAWVTRA
jgi:hypothetical protein